MIWRFRRTGSPSVVIRSTSATVGAMVVTEAFSTNPIGFCYFARSVKSIDKVENLEDS